MEESGRRLGIESRLSVDWQLSKFAPYLLVRLSSDLVSCVRYQDKLAQEGRKSKSF